MIKVNRDSPRMPRQLRAGAPRAKDEASAEASNCRLQTGVRDIFEDFGECCGQELVAEDVRPRTRVVPRQC